MYQTLNPFFLKVGRHRFVKRKRKTTQKTQQSTCDDITEPKDITEEDVETDGEKKKIQSPSLSPSKKKKIEEPQPENLDDDPTDNSQEPECLSIKKSSKKTNKKTKSLKRKRDSLSDDDEIDKKKKKQKPLKPTDCLKFPPQINTLNVQEKNDNNNDDIKMDDHNVVQEDEKMENLTAKIIIPEFRHDDQDELERLSYIGSIYSAELYSAAGMETCENMTNGRENVLLQPDEEQELSESHVNETGDDNNDEDYSYSDSRYIDMLQKNENDLESSNKQEESEDNGIIISRTENIVTLDDMLPASMVDGKPCFLLYGNGLYLRFPLHYYSLLNTLRIRVLTKINSLFNMGVVVELVDLEKKLNPEKYKNDDIKIIRKSKQINDSVELNILPDYIPKPIPGTKKMSFYSSKPSVHLGEIPPKIEIVKGMSIEEKELIRYCTVKSVELFHETALNNSTKKRMFIDPILNMKLFPRNCWGFDFAVIYKLLRINDNMTRYADNFDKSRFVTLINSIYPDMEYHENYFMEHIKSTILSHEKYKKQSLKQEEQESKNIPPQSDQQDDYLSELLNYEQRDDNIKEAFEDTDFDSDSSIQEKASVMIQKNTLNEISQRVKYWIEILLPRIEHKEYKEMNNMDANKKIKVPKKVIYHKYRVLPLPLLPFFLDSLSTKRKIHNPVCNIIHRFLDYLKIYRNQVVTRGMFAEPLSDVDFASSSYSLHSMNGLSSTGGLGPNKLNVDIVSLDCAILQFKTNYEKLLFNIQQRQIEMHHFGQSILYEMRDSVNSVISDNHKLRKELLASKRKCKSIEKKFESLEEKIKQTNKDNKKSIKQLKSENKKLRRAIKKL